MQKVFYALFAVLLGIVVACWWAYQSSSATISNQIQDATRQTVQQASSSLALWMERYEKVADGIALDLMSESGSYRRIEDNGVAKFLELNRNKVKGIEQLYEFPTGTRDFSGDNDTFITNTQASDKQRTQEIAYEDGKQGVWLNQIEAANERAVWIPAVKGGFGQFSATNDYRILLGRTYDNAQQTLMMEIGTSALDDQYQSIQIGENGRFAVVDEQQMVVYSSNPEWVGKAYPTDLKAAIASGMADGEDVELGTMRFIVEKVPDRSWHVVGSLPVAELNQAVQQQFWTMIFSAILLMAGLALTFILFRRQQALYNTLAQLHAELKIQSDELAVKNEQLTHLNKLKDQILANTSHELRTPLNGIIGIADSVIDGAAGPISPEVRSNLKLIVSSGRRLSSLVNDILDFSKMQNKTISLRSKPLEVHSIAKLVWDLSKPLLGNKPIVFQNDLPVVGAKVFGDEDRVMQIFHNLIGNAIKFTERGSISVRASMEFGMMAVTVRDSGMGIPKEQFDRIFHSFEQGDGSTERAFGGTGLGLSVTKQLVELHGGTIRVESEVGIYSAFTFTLPLATDEQMADYEEPSLKDGASAMAKSDTETADAMDYQPVHIVGETQILLVDDEPVNLQVLVNQLRPLGFGITTAANGLEALGLIKQHGSFDLVLCDVMMPKMSGYDVTRKIREQFSELEMPVILLTAKTQPEDIKRGFEMGANDYLTKPFSKPELVARMQTHLKLSKSIRQVKAMKGRLEQILKDKQIPIPREDAG